MVVPLEVPRAKPALLSAVVASALVLSTMFGTTAVVGAT